jgi:mono/diheme cytochrome c family protein
MRAHFVDVALARDAVIRGNLAGVRPPLERIAHERYGDDLPADWLTWVAEMQRDASLHAGVSELAAAGEAVAELSATCADCHRTTRGGPEDEEVEPPSVDASDLRGQMTLHAFGAERMWVGLTAPSHQAWVQGARAIASIEEASDTEQGAGLEALRSFAAQAADAGPPAAKKRMYAELLVQCASCHRASPAP